MNLLDIALWVFIVMETANICILYFAPDSKRGNGVAVFNAWERSKQNENDHLFARYMTSWVAGTKLIFIVLLLVIVRTADLETKPLAVLAMIASIATYFWKLHPIIKALDRNGDITPKGYSKVLGTMIAGFLIMFSAAFILHILLQ